MDPRIKEGVMERGFSTFCSRTLSKIWYESKISLSQVRCKECFCFTLHSHPYHKWNHHLGILMQQLVSFRQWWHRSMGDLQPYYPEYHLRIISRYGEHCLCFFLRFIQWNDLNFSFLGKLFSNPTEADLKKWFQLGSVAAYQHCSMIKLHYTISHALDDCLSDLEEDDLNPLKRNRRKLKQKLAERQRTIRERGYSLNSSVFPINSKSREMVESDCHSALTMETLVQEDELTEDLDVGFNPPRRVVVK